MFDDYFNCIPIIYPNIQFVIIKIYYFNFRNTCLTKYFKNQIDFEIWEQQRNELNVIHIY